MKSPYRETNLKPPPSGGGKSPAHKNTSYLKYVEYFLNDILSYESFNALKEKEILSESIESGNKNLSFRI